MKEPSWENYEQLVHKIVHVETSKYWWINDEHMEEVRGAATLAFCVALKKYNPDKAQFSTFLYRCVQNEVKDAIARIQSEPCLWGLPIAEENATAEEPLPTPAELQTTDHHGKLFMQELLSNLGADAREMVRVAIKESTESAYATLARTRKQLSTRARRDGTHKGRFTPGRLASAQMEIRAVLATV